MALVAALATCLAWAPAASAISVDTFDVTPDSPDAGAHSDLAIGLTKVPAEAK